MSSIPKIGNVDLTWFMPDIAVSQDTVKDAPMRMQEGTNAFGIFH